MEPNKGKDLEKIYLFFCLGDSSTRLNAFIFFEPKIHEIQAKMQNYVKVYYRKMILMI